MSMRKWYQAIAFLLGTLMIAAGLWNSISIIVIIGLGFALIGGPSWPSSSE